MELLGIFVNVLLPIFILIGFGALLDRQFKIDVKSVSRLTFYVLSPCLIFSSLANSTVSGEDSSKMFLFSIVSTLAMASIAWLVGKAIKLDQTTSAAFMLTVMFMNSGNYGLSVNLFAFGEEGLARAALFFVANAVLSNTMGVFLAARGRYSLKEAIISVLKAPMVYAAIAGILVNIWGVSVPEPLTKAFTIAGDGAVPSLLLILGVQLGRTAFNEDLKLVAVAAVLRLGVAAALAFLLAAVMGLEGVSRQAGIVEASMPSAITPLLIAVEYDTRPRFVTSVIFVTTLVSMLTLTLLLSALM